MGILKMSLSLASLLMLLPMVVLAQDTFTPDGSHLGDFKLGEQTFNIFQLVFGADVPADILNTNDVLQKLLFPFLAVWMIMYGILTEIRIFRKYWINSVITLLIAIIASASGALWGVVRVFFQAGGFLGTIAFGVLLIVGIAFWFVARSSEFGLWKLFGKGKWGREPSKRLAIESLLDQLGRIRDEARDAGSFTEAQTIQTAMSKARGHLAKGELDQALDVVQEARKEVPHAGA